MNLLRKYLFASSLTAFLALTVWAHLYLERLTSPPPAPREPRRIVSLAPSVTETLYSLGLGPQVVGVTQYCRYPPEAAAKPKVAGFSDVNYEAVLRLKPDLVALPLDKTMNNLFLTRLGLPCLAVDTRSIDGLIEAVQTLGRATGHQAEAGIISRRIDERLEWARKRAQGRPRPRVLFSIMRSYQEMGPITEINAVGRDGFYNQMLEIAGGRNVYEGRLPFPRLSREAIIYLNPEVIIDVIPAREDLAAARRDWDGLSSVEAVKNNRLFFLTDEADTIPGPRFPDTLRKLSLAFHPEEPWPTP